MPIKDLLSIILKLYGLHQLIQLILDFLRGLSNKNYGWELFGFTYLDGGSSAWLIYATFILESLIYLYFIFKTKKIVNLFNLKSYNINFNSITNLDILRNGIVLIGIFLIISNMTFFFRNIFLLFYQEVSFSILELKKNYLETKEVDFMMWKISGIEMVIGYLLIRNSISISNWLIKND